MRRPLLTLATLAGALAGTGTFAVAAFTESATNGGNTFAAAADFVPVSDSVPDVAGAPKQGATLSASTGDWLLNPDSYAYQWERCDATGGSCADITLATASSYTPGAGDATTNTLRVRVRAVNGTQSQTARSEPTDTVKSSLSDAPTNTTMPTISDTTPAVGDLLAVTPGTWSLGAMGAQYQWQRCNAVGASCTDISLATASSYTVTSADRGARLRVVESRIVTVTRNRVATPDTAIVP